jgi:hypothetical protein
MFERASATRGSIAPEPKQLIDPAHSPYYHLFKMSANYKNRLSVSNVLLLVVLFSIPLPLFGAETGAMLYVKGQARLNGGTVPGSSAIFSGDTVQTEADSAANINALGSNVVISPNSLLIFQTDGINLERGAVTVATSKGIVVHVGDITVAAAHSSWTQFEVSDGGGTIHIVATKGDLSVTDGAGTTQMAEGNQTTRPDPESNHKKDRAVAGARGPLIPPEVYEAAAAGGVGAFLAYELSQDHIPASPIKP